MTNDNTWPKKTGHCIVRFGQKILTGHLPKKPDCPVKNRTPGNPICKTRLRMIDSYCIRRRRYHHHFTYIFRKIADFQVNIHHELDGTENRS